MAIPSSSPVIINEIDPTKFSLSSRNFFVAETNEAIAPFISVAPRPIIFPSISLASNGSADQLASSPSGTTSV